MEEIAFPEAQSPTPEAGDRICRGIKLRDGRTVGASAIIITTGTFLNGLIHCGEQQYPAGRSGEPAAVLLGESLKQLGLRGCRLKTGTPPRLDGRTIDWSQFQASARRCRPYSVQLPYQARSPSRFASAMLHCMDHARNPTHHPRERPSLAHV